MHTNLAHIGAVIEVSQIFLCRMAVEEEDFAARSLSSANQPCRYHILTAADLAGAFPANPVTLINKYLDATCMTQLTAVGWEFTPLKAYSSSWPAAAFQYLQQPSDARFAPCEAGDRQSIGSEGRPSSDSDVACETSIEADPGSFQLKDSCRSSFDRSPECGWHSSKAHEARTDMTAQSTGARWKQLSSAIQLSVNPPPLILPPIRC